VARAEVTHAFAGLRVTVSEQRDARYRVRVLQRLRDPRFRSDVEVAGSSRSVSMFGGDGAVNFAMLAGYAESFAPADADRATIVAAIGRGVGRAAVHEFAHQLLGSAGIDESDDVQSYEYGSAARREQYYGEMHWGGAWAKLSRRFGAGDSHLSVEPSGRCVDIAPCLGGADDVREHVNSPCSLTLGRASTARWELYDPGRGRVT
jgi:hypothetical protein